MAYDIVTLLKQQDENHILQQLKSWINNTQKSDNKLHEVFEPAFDWKPAWRQIGNAEQKSLLFKNKSTCITMHVLVDYVHLLKNMTIVLPGFILQVSKEFIL